MQANSGNKVVIRLEWVAVVSVIAAISGMILGWTGKARWVRDEIRAKAGTDATLKTDMDYIKRGIDEVRLDQREQARRFDGLAERVTRLEETMKSMDQRIERVEKREGRAER